MSQAQIFFARCGGRADVRGKGILDLGLGFGSTSIFLAYRRLRVPSPGTMFTVPLEVKPLDSGSLAQADLAEKRQLSVAGKAGWIIPLRALLG